MNELVFSPFTKATSDVLKMMLDLDAQASEPKVLDHLEAVDEAFGIVIGLTGDFSGNVLYRFPKATMLGMVEIMSGMAMDQVDDFVKSAIGEIANIISGNALIDLSASQVKCDILPPRFVEDGNGITLDGKPIISSVIQTSLGNIGLDIQV